MFIASLSVVVGWATLFGAVILVAYAVLLFVFFSLFIRFYEEPRLAQEFGSDYTAYVSRVARLVALASQQEGHLKAPTTKSSAPCLRRRLEIHPRGLDST